MLGGRLPPVGCTRTVSGPVPFGLWRGESQYRRADLQGLLSA